MKSFRRLVAAAALGTVLMGAVPEASKAASVSVTSDTFSFSFTQSGLTLTDELFFTISGLAHNQSATVNFTGDLLVYSGSPTSSFGNVSSLTPNALAQPTGLYGLPVYQPFSLYYSGFKNGNFVELAVISANSGIPEGTLNAPTIQNISAVPLPGAIVLFASAIAGLGGFARLRSRKRQAA